MLFWRSSVKAVSASSTAFVRYVSTMQLARVWLTTFHLPAENNNIYVMKEVAFEDRASLEAALSEKQLMSRVSHRHICKYVDSFISMHGENKLYLIMEYAEKGDLE